MVEKIKTFGSRAEVWHQTAVKTRGNLRKKDLMQTKNGRIVSRKAHAAGKKAIKRLRALGYVAKKGTFKLFRKGDAHSRKASSRKRRSTRRRRGGFADAAGAVKDMMGAVSGASASTKY